MAVALILDFPGGSRADYDEVVRRMDLGGHLATGGLAHVAGSFAGGWRVMDVWEDMEAFERFRDEQIVPHTRAVGMGPPKVRVVELTDGLQEGEGATPAFAQCVFLEGMDAEGFAAVDSAILPDGRRPTDVVWHVHGPAEGGWCVVDTWTSRAARDRFIQEKVMPAMQQAGAAAPPRIEDMDVEATLAPQAAAARPHGTRGAGRGCRRPEGARPAGPGPAVPPARPPRGPRP